MGTPVGQADSQPAQAAQAESASLAQGSSVVLFE